MRNMENIGRNRLIIFISITEYNIPYTPLYHTLKTRANKIRGFWPLIDLTPFN